MHLSPTEVALFYKLKNALLAFVNERLKVLPELGTLEQVTVTPLAEKAKIRDAVYEHPELIDAFLAENPRNFDPEELDVVAGWRRFVRGDFVVFRALKRHSIFIDSGSPAKAYGVVGLSHDVEEILPPPPVYVSTVLLPFKGRIVYDGLLYSYSVTLGPGIRRNLNETYQAIRENQGVITSLDPDAAGEPAPVAARRRKPVRDLLPELERLVKETESLRDAETPVQRKALALLRAAANLARATAARPEDWDGITRAARKAHSALGQVVTTLNRRLTSY